MDWPKNIATGIFSGVLAGLFFGLVMYWFSKSKWAKPKTRLTWKQVKFFCLKPELAILKVWRPFGGWLYLTSSKLIFKSHRFNIRNHELTILLSDIATAGRYKTTAFTNNGLKVETRAGGTEKFVVQQPAEWVDRLTVSQIGVASI